MNATSVLTRSEPTPVAGRELALHPAPHQKQPDYRRKQQREGQTDSQHDPRKEGALGRDLGLVTRDDWDELELRVAQVEHRLSLLERAADEQEPKP